MNKSKIYDCITFFDENLITNARFEILNHVVHKFIVCESLFDHKGNEKKLNFNLINEKFKKKVTHLVLKEPFNYRSNGWKNEEIQRNHLFHGIQEALENDIILFSDSDEIPDPNILENFNLNKKYGIFLQDFYTYKLNVFNKYESPWEGTRAVRIKDLKNFNFLRKKIQSKNLKKNFLKFWIEKDIELYPNGGWHFNNLYHLEKLSQKIKASPHQEFNLEKITNLSNIKKKIENLEDLYGRGHKYQKVEINETFPEYIRNNKKIFSDFIL
tara:strand:- start:186 stop:995 length:810 start_codon:yes stop_codon:yes gene_type:complete